MVSSELFCVKVDKCREPGLLCLDAGSSFGSTLLCQIQDLSDRGWLSGRLPDRRDRPTAFPARHVVRNSIGGAPQGQHSYESYQAMEDQWNEWTILCIVGLIGIMLTSIVTANRRSQPGKMSHLLELETRWKLTGSSTAGAVVAELKLQWEASGADGTRLSGAAFEAPLSGSLAEPSTMLHRSQQLEEEVAITQTAHFERHGLKLARAQQLCWVLREKLEAARARKGGAASPEGRELRALRELSEKMRRAALKLIEEAGPCRFREMSARSGDRQYLCRTLCVICRRVRSLRSFHCKLCGCCVQRMDHHCPWVDRCIGLQNQRSFYVFLLVLAAVFILFIQLSLTFLEQDGPAASRPKALPMPTLPAALSAALPAAPTMPTMPSLELPSDRTERLPPNMAMPKPALPSVIPSIPGIPEGDKTLSLDEMVKKVGEKVNKAGGLQAIGYGARAGKPYVRGRPDDVVANEYRKSPYGPIRGNDKKDDAAPQSPTEAGRYSGGMGSMGQLY
eukprot:g22070.t1